MALSLFTFEVSKPYEEDFERAADFGEAETGRDTVRALSSRDRFLVNNGTLIFPGIDGTTIRDLHTFWRAHSGPVKKFLYKAIYPENFIDRLTGTAGAGQTDFPLTFRHVDTAVTSITLDASSKTHSIVNNDLSTVALRLDVAAVGGEAYVITYDYFSPVRFADLGLPNEFILRTGTDFTDKSELFVAFRLREATAGGRYA